MVRRRRTRRGEPVLILLDTHVLIWMSSGDSRLRATTRRTIEQGLQDFDPAVSAISFWEVGMRVDKGQLGLNTDLLSWRRGFLDTGISEVPVDGEIAARAGLLPLLHGDPVDRLIVATALGGHQLVTADRRILDWSGNLHSLDATE